MLAPSSAARRKVHSEREFDVAAEQAFEEGGDRWLTHRLDAADQRQSLIEEGVDAARLLQALRQLLEIHADGEVRRALGGDDERTDRVVGGDFNRFADVDVLERHAAERIVVGGDDRDAVVALGQDQCIGQRESRWRRAASWSKTQGGSDDRVTRALS